MHEAAAYFCHLLYRCKFFGCRRSSPVIAVCDLAILVVSGTEYSAAEVVFVHCADISVHFKSYPGIQPVRALVYCGTTKGSSGDSAAPHIDFPYIIGGGIFRRCHIHPCTERRELFSEVRYGALRDRTGCSSGDSACIGIHRRFIVVGSFCILRCTIGIHAAGKVLICRVNADRLTAGDSPHIKPGHTSAYGGCISFPCSAAVIVRNGIGTDVSINIARIGAVFNHSGIFTGHSAGTRIVYAVVFLCLTCICNINPGGICAVFDRAAVRTGNSPCTEAAECPGKNRNTKPNDAVIHSTGRFTINRTRYFAVIDRPPVRTGYRPKRSACRFSDPDIVQRQIMDPCFTLQRPE